LKINLTELSYNRNEINLKPLEIATQKLYNLSLINYKKTGIKIEEFKEMIDDLSKSKYQIQYVAQDML
jgi:hypothetical protein